MERLPIFINKNQSTYMFLNQAVRKIAVIRIQAHHFQCACVKPLPYSGEIVSTTASIRFLKVSRYFFDTTSLLTSPLTRYVRWITKKSILHILPGLAPRLPYKLAGAVPRPLACLYSEKREFFTSIYQYHVICGHFNNSICFTQLRLKPLQ